MNVSTPHPGTTKIKAAREIEEHEQARTGHDATNSDLTEPSQIPTLGESDDPDSGEDSFGNDEIPSSTANGMELDTKCLYRSNRWSPWTEQRPDDVDHGDEEIHYKRYALVVRREKDPEGFKLILDSISVHSPYIRRFLTRVFEGYQGIYTGIRRLTFKPPFHEFYYQWDKLQQLLAEVHDSLARQHIDLLLDAITPEIKAHLAAKDDLLANGIVTFEYLWTIFPPNSEIYSKSNDIEQFYTTVDCSYRKGQNSMRFILQGKYIDHNGSELGYATDEFVIDEFTGHRKISDLNPLPGALLPKVATTRARLTRRGKVFMQLVGSHFKTYKGVYVPARTPNSFGTKQRHIDKGRIMIDAGMFYEQFPDLKPSLLPLDAEEPEDGASDTFSGSSDMVPLRELEDDSSDRHFRDTLKEHEFRLCTPFVQGYCLLNKQWATFRTSQVSPIEWDEDAFDKLVLPRDNKELILAFAESQLSHEDHFDDVISGKGQGIIILLTGEPGVGKTLTAESVAEQVRRPLYAMSAGELGYAAGEVEENLRKVLEISAKWDAVLLLDECDVFLEQRTSDNIERNKLTAVFLRLLEYYKGVMFLTTNRIATFDAAVHSRIHLTIAYPSLGFDSRRKVWQTFATAIDGDARYESQLTEQDLDQLARLEYNGRHIKNTIKTARLLARRRGVILAMDHVQTVLRIKQENSGLITK